MLCTAVTYYVGNWSPRETALHSRSRTFAERWAATTRPTQGEGYGVSFCSEYSIAYFMIYCFTWCYLFILLNNSIWHRTIVLIWTIFVVECLFYFVFCPIVVYAILFYSILYYMSARNRQGPFAVWDMKTVHRGAAPQAIGLSRYSSR